MPHAKFNIINTNNNSVLISKTWIYQHRWSCVVGVQHPQWHQHTDTLIRERCNEVTANFSAFQNAWFCCQRGMWFVLLTSCLLVCHQVWSTFVKLMHQSLYCLEGIFSGNFKQTLVRKRRQDWSQSSGLLFIESNFLVLWYCFALFVFCHRNILLCGKEQRHFEKSPFLPTLLGFHFIACVSDDDSRWIK